MMEGPHDDPNEDGFAAAEPQESEATIQPSTSEQPKQAFEANPQDLVHMFSSTLDAFRAAIKGRDAAKAQALLEDEGPAIARFEYEWIDDLYRLGYNAKEVVEALIQEKDVWIYYTQPALKTSMISSFHQSDCTHFWSQGTSVMVNKVAESPHSKPRSQGMSEETIKQTVAEMCGLAGVIPVSTTLSEWNGQVNFSPDNPSVAGISYTPCRDSTGCLGFVMTVHRICTILNNIVDLCGWLQENGLCCNSFTILICPRKDATVEVISVPFSMLRKIQTTMASLDIAPQEQDLLNGALHASINILHIFYPTTEFPVSLGMPGEFEGIQKDILEYSALAAQSLCVGMLSFSNAHTGPLKPFFLEHEVFEVHMRGMDKANVVLSARLVELGCMKNMLGDRVLAFTSTEVTTDRVRHKLLASPEDLVETWGPGQYLTDGSDSQSQRLFAIAIGGGIVRATQDVSLLHWEQGSLDTKLTELLSGHAFDAHRKSLIGGHPTLNSECPMAEIALTTMQLGSPRDFLGVSRDQWAVTERQLGGQLGYSYAFLTANQTWTKIKGRTLKDVNLLRDRESLPIAFLDAPWGVQVSLCTSVAQRVPLREVVANVIKPMIEDEVPLPEGWLELLQKHHAIENLRSARFGEWARTELPEDMQTTLARAVHRVLVALHNTGFDTSTEELVVACALPSDPFRCFRIACKDRQLWARLLRDSDCCATFACVTTHCLETRAWKCQGQASWQRHIKPILLATAVSQFEIRKDKWQMVLGELQAGVDYCFGDNGVELIAKWVSESPHQSAKTVETRLEIEQLRVPARILKILYAKRPTRRLQERQSIADSFAKEVLLHDKTRTGVIGLPGE